MINNLILLQGLLPGLDGGDAAKAGEEATKVAGGMSELKSLSLQDLLNRLAESASSASGPPRSLQSSPLPVLPSVWR